MTLPQDMVDLLSSGVAHQVGACTDAGRPVVCRGLAAQLEPDGRLLVLVSSESGFEVIGAIRENGRIAMNVTLPANFRSMSFLGTDAVICDDGPGFRGLVEQRRAAFQAQLVPYGFPDSYSGAWYPDRDEHIVAIRFHPEAARNQTPGPGAGAALDLGRP